MDVEAALELIEHWRDLMARGFKESAMLQQERDVLRLAGVTLAAYIRRTRNKQAGP